MIKISEISLTQRFDDSMSSFSSEKNKRVKILQLNINRERRWNVKNVHVRSDKLDISDKI